MIIYWDINKVTVGPPPPTPVVDEGCKLIGIITNNELVGVVLPSPKLIGYIEC